MGTTNSMSPPEDPVCSCWATGTERFNRRCRSEPVSYTHLDVYKRQREDCGGSANDPISSTEQMPIP